ncbi:MAG: cytochrome P450 [Kineosporiaceae bacterium]
MEPDSLFMPLTRTGLDPVAELARRREEEPVSRLDLFGNTVWLVTRYDDVRRVLGDVEAFSNDFANLLAAGGDDAEELGLADPGGLGFRDPPEHTRLRRLLAPSFSARRLEALQPRIRDVVDRRLDALEAVGPPADLVSLFATAVPSMVIGEVLGVPEEERIAFGELAAHRFDLIESILAPLDSAAASIDYLLGLIDRQRQNPGDGLLARLIRENPDMDDRELAGLADGLLVGGHETTASMIALSTVVLLTDPERAARLRDEATDPDPVIEELLRYLTVVQVAFPRFARTDTTIGDQKVAAGDLVLCSLSAANRDVALGPGLEQVDLTRPPTPHLAFAYGIHHCLGAQLARLELRIALPALLRRFPGLRLAVDPAEIRYSQRSIVYGVEELPVAW